MVSVLGEIWCNLDEFEKANNNITLYYRQKEKINRHLIQLQILFKKQNIKTIVTF